MLFALLSTVAVMADTTQTVFIGEATVDKFVSQLTFDGDNITLTFADGTTQTADMGEVSIDLTYDNKDTGISEINKNDAPTEAVYSLGGQYIGTSTKGLSKGIYVVKGKKLIIK